MKLQSFKVHPIKQIFQIRALYLVSSKKVPRKSICSSAGPGILERICESEIEGIKSDEVSNSALRELA
jgi:hypothetical protein